jgi:colicin import membrane protein
MNKLFAALIAGAFAFASVSAFADDATPSKVTTDDQAKLKAETAQKKAAAAKLTKEEKKAARKAANEKKRADQTKMEKIGDTGSQLRTAEDAKATAASKAAPAPAKGTMNTPEAEKAMQKQKGQ